MNFNCVGKNSKGERYMKFNIPFTPLEKIQLLQRSILVHSFAYYELNNNIISDSDYDSNAKQLMALAKKHPNDYKISRYYKYFHDYFSENDKIHYTSGFDLLERVKKEDPELYRILHIDASNAIYLKNMYFRSYN